VFDDDNMSFTHSTPGAFRLVTLRQEDKNLTVETQSRRENRKAPRGW